MRNLITSILILFVGCTFSMNLMAQAPSDETVTLVSSGEGATKDEAIKKALLYAIEQTYGTFVSSNTTILNDELIQDEIVTVSSGNVVSYEIISEDKIGDSYIVFLKAVVSIGKLSSFVKSEGGEAELAGATFAMNVKIDKFYKKNEILAFNHLRYELYKIIPTMFDYTIELGEPKKSEQNNSLYEVRGAVLIHANENAMIFLNRMSQLLESLGADKPTEHTDLKRLIYVYFPEYLYSGGSKDSNFWQFLNLAESNNKIKTLFFRNYDPIYIDWLYGHIIKELSNFIIYDGIRQYEITDIYKSGNYIKVHPTKAENENCFFASSKVGYVGKMKLEDSNFFHYSPNGADFYALPVKGLVGGFPFTLVYTLEELNQISKITVSPKSAK